MEIALINDHAAACDIADERREMYARLVEEVKRGNLGAFEQLMISAERRVMRTAWRMLGAEEDARDATQETFMRAYKYIQRFKLDQDFSAWLYRITINVCHDMRRKHRARFEHFTSLEEERGSFENLASAHNEEEALIARQHQAIIARALDTLTVHERAAIVLRDFEGLTTEEVAGILGSRPATVRSQISSARQKIKIYCDRFLRTTGAKQVQRLNERNLRGDKR